MRTILIAMVLSVVFLGCAATIKPRSELTPPTPAADMSGKYVSPFKSDGSVTDWAEKSWSEEVSKNIAGNIGSNVGSQVGSALGGGWGSLIGASAGKVGARKATHEAFLLALGGEDYIRETSELSFNSLAELSKYLYVVNSDHPQYKEALNAAMYLYPELEDVYPETLESL